MCKASFSKGQTDVIDHQESTSTWAQILYKDCREDKKNGIHPIMEQTETAMMAERKSQIEKVVSSFTKVKLMIAAEVACKTKW